MARFRCIGCSADADVPAHICPSCGKEDPYQFKLAKMFYKVLSLAVFLLVIWLIF
jgi:rRNA maturation endonuclease Nob1